MKGLAMRFLTSLLAIALAAACAPPAVGPGAAGRTSRIAFPFDWEFRGLDPIGTGSQGMVATADARATRVGLDILQAGGNAVDAAVAVGFALAVVLPSAGNLGGGGFAVLRQANGEVASLDFREMAPLQAVPERFRDAEGIPTDATRVGHLAVGVPGTVAGLAELHASYGSLPWEDLVAPAIDLAENGFTVTESLHRGLAAKASILTQFDATRQTFYPGGEAPRVGSSFRQPALAGTLREIAAQGKDAFYSGRIADLIVQEMRRGDGLITHEDLRRYRANWRDPIVFDYRSHTIISMPPPSSGGVTLAEALNILEGFNLRELGFNTPDAIHLLVESFRRAFADRNYYLGDPDYVEIPIDRLTSDQYAAELRATISRSRASSSDEFNRVPVLSEGFNTTHYSIVDSQGNAVALTYTLNSSYGSGVVVDRAGFFLNNELDDFTVRAGYANQFGLVQSDANLIGPGRRPLSAMTPTIVVSPEGQLRLVTGSPGGPRIITAVAQTIINVIDYGMDVRTAVDAPRIHHQLLPDEIEIERNGMDNSTLSVLAGFGHRFTSTGEYFGNIQLIIREPNGTLYGASDPRREDGRALGY
ncbi:MAG: gamma-glutamyltransferase [Gemmatimonadota bacterium]|nr:MAG: gamma-glutamyltransferase [Gemmatimonadota bacterium]